MIHRSAIRATALSLTAAAALLAGCSNMSEREKGTATGAGIGAAAGAVLSSMTGGKSRHRRSRRRCDRRSGRQRLVQAAGRTPRRDGAGHPRHRRRREPHGRQPAQGQHPERRLLRHRQRHYQAADARRAGPVRASVKDDPNTRLTIVGHTDSTVRMPSTTRCRWSARKACATIWPQGRGADPRADRRPRRA